MTFDLQQNNKILALKVLQPPTKNDFRLNSPSCNTVTTSRGHKHTFMYAQSIGIHMTLEENLQDVKSFFQDPNLPEKNPSLGGLMTGVSMPMMDFITASSAKRPY